MDTKPSSNLYIVIVGSLGLGSIVYLFVAQPGIAPAAVPFILTFVGGILVMLQKGKETDAKVDVLVPKVDTAIAQSRQNNLQLTEVVAVTEQVASAMADNTAITQQIDAKVDKVDGTATETHLAVNSRMDELIARVEKQERTQARLEAVLARAEGITEGRGQMGALPNEAKP